MRALHFASSIDAASTKSTKSGIPPGPPPGGGPPGGPSPKPPGGPSSNPPGRGPPKGLAPAGGSIAISGRVADVAPKGSGFAGTLSANGLGTGPASPLSPKSPGSTASPFSPTGNDWFWSGDVSTLTSSTDSPPPNKGGILNSDNAKSP